MSLIRYTPYLMTNLQQQINRMFDDMNSNPGSEGLGGGMFTPAVDIKEDADAYTIHVEVPGIEQDKLNITLQDNVLTVRGRREGSQEFGEGQFRRVERSYGTFARSLTLPRNVDGSNVSANLQDGVLEVRLPKREEARPRQINIGTTVQGNALQSSESQSNAALSPGAEETAEDVPVQVGEGAEDTSAPSDDESANGAQSEDAPEGNPT